MVVLLIVAPFVEAEVKPNHAAAFVPFGAPLLGVDGICIVSHGSSKTRTIRNAVALAADSVRARMVEAIRADVARLAELAVAQGFPAT